MERGRISLDYIGAWIMSECVMVFVAKEDPKIVRRGAPENISDKLLSRFTEHDAKMRYLCHSGLELSRERFDVVDPQHPNLIRTRMSPLTCLDGSLAIGPRVTLKSKVLQPFAQ